MSFTNKRLFALSLGAFVLLAGFTINKLTEYGMIVDLFQNDLSRNT
jgi:hypothetical protein